jgi:ABC-type transport system involved in cytochrome bd biosynthesis fused ATPase/permease subunit
LPRWADIVIAIAIAILPTIAVGFLTSSSGWSIAALFALLFLLAMWEIYRRERQAHQHSSSEVTTLQWALDVGDWALTSYHTECTRLGMAQTEEETEKAWGRIKDATGCILKWTTDTEEAIAKTVNLGVAQMFKAHPNITSGRLMPPDLPSFAQKLWNDTACRLEWIARRLEPLAENRR